MSPWDYSLRELDWMATGRERAAWWHTSYQMALHANIHRDKRQRATPYRPAEFHPIELSRRKTEPAALKLNRQQTKELLKSLFIEKRIPDALT